MDTAGVLTLMQEVADEVVMPRFQSLADDEVIEKNPGDLVTVADREAEVLITKALQDAFPGCVVVGEEACAADPSVVNAVAAADHVFVVDPVDGTRNFVHGRSDFGLMVAEMRGAEGTRSWIWQPVAGQSWVAEHGAGVQRGGKKFKARPFNPPARGATGEPRDTGAHPEGDLVNSRWACAIDYPLVAAGELDFVLYRSSNPWDHVPGWVMLTELGGLMVFADGKPYTGKPRKKGLAAMTHPDVWDQIQPLVHRLMA